MTGIAVATMLAVGASFWGSHGQPIPRAVTWDWYTPAIRKDGATEQARATFGSFHVLLSREWWDHATNQDRCVVVIHELGHAAFGFPHAPGVMAVFDEDRPVPGTCRRTVRQWRRAS